jgi:hypothetical protein
MFPRFIWITLHCRNRYFVYPLIRQLTFGLFPLFGSLTMDIDLFLWKAFYVLVYVSMEWNCWYHMVTLFNSLRNCQTVFHSGWSALHSPSSVWGPQCLHILISTCYCPPLEPWSHYLVRGHISLCLPGKSGCKVLDKY